MSPTGLAWYAVAATTVCYALAALLFVRQPATQLVVAFAVTGAVAFAVGRVAQGPLLASRELSRRQSLVGIAVSQGIALVGFVIVAVAGVQRLSVIAIGLSLLVLGLAWPRPSTSQAARRLS